MRKTTTIAAAFLALAGFASAAQAADDARRSDGNGPRSVARFEAADADANGEVTFEEFAEAINGRLGKADADGDGKMTVGEIARAGADTFVAGSAIFGAPDYRATIGRMREEIAKAGRG